MVEGRKFQRFQFGFIIGVLVTIICRYQILASPTNGGINLGVGAADLTTTTVAGVLRSFGEGCNSTTPCDPSAHLGCNTELGSCSCCLSGNEDDQFFDGVSKSCLVKPNKNCFIHYRKSSRSSSSSGDNSPHANHAVPCAALSTCKLSNRGHSALCVCDDGYYFDGAQSCALKIDLGGSCNETAQCKNSPTVSCLSQKCDCPRKDNVTGKCIVGFRERCNGVIGCEPGLGCVNGQCLCEFPLQQKYNVKTSVCESILGGPCGARSAGVGDQGHPIPCVNGSVCSTSTASGLQTCTCPAGRIQDEFGTCTWLDYGQPCGNSDLIPEEDYFVQPRQPTCDKTSSLYCRQGKCDCLDSLKLFNPVTRLCEGLVGSLCNPHLKAAELLVGPRTPSSPHQHRHSTDWIIDLVGAVDVVGLSTICGGGSTCLRDHDGETCHCGCNSTTQVVTPQRTCALK